MHRSIFISAMVTFAVALSPAPRAHAGSDAVAGAIIGGIIGGAIANQSRQKTYTKRTYTKKSSVSSAQRAENRSVQHALNYFGFNAGTADGVMGRNSRSAVSSYQAHLGYPATGQLTSYEKDFLLTSHNRALAGGPATNQMIAANPMGTRGLLLTYRDQAAGIVTQQPGTVTAMPPGTTVVVNPQVTTPMPQATAPATVVAGAAGAVAGAATTQLAAAASKAPQMPSFFGNADQRSLASHCNAVNLMTNAKGGFTDVAQMTDPKVVLNEQFCLARTYAIAQSEKLMGQVQGVSAADVTAQCKQLAPLLKEQVASVSVTNRPAVIDKVSSFVLSTGMAPNQMAQTARICLGDGYRVDDMDVALASALILVVLGEPVYSELLGHHLTAGFGTSERVDLAYDWYQASSDAVARGATQVFAPGQAGRTELILTAATEVKGGTGAAMGTVPQPASANSVPTFNIAQ